MVVGVGRSAKGKCLARAGGMRVGPPVGRRPNTFRVGVADTRFWGLVGVLTAASRHRDS